MKQCEDCLYLEYDQELDADVCTMTLDEDEMYRFLQGRSQACPYYRRGDDYSLARRQ